MTVTMDHKTNRKSSWDSKMSVSTVSSATRQFRRSPSSILSSDSDIRFTRKKLSSGTRCGCCIIALFLLFLLLAAGALYVAYTFFMPEPLEDQIFRATFRVTEGDNFTPDLADPANDNFRFHSQEYKQRLNSLFHHSDLGHKFLGTEVLALDGNEGKDLIVHFNVLIDPTVSVEAQEIEDVLYQQITNVKSPYFTNLTIDSSSLDVQKYIGGTTTSTSLPSTKTSVLPSSTNRPPPPRQCTPLKLKYCSRLPYNMTSYPNILGHKSLREVEEDVISFRELVDAECYRQAYDFVCQVLQPGCIKSKPEDLPVLPCRSFCRDFMMGCGSRLLPKLKEHLDCNRFPEFSGPGLCKPKTECVHEMQQRALSSRVCDGVVDCQDLADEKSCTYCPKGFVHCGLGRTCIPVIFRCDGKMDCSDGSDERACLSIAPNIANVTKLKFVTPHLPQYHSEGFVVFNEKGQVGKVCTENVNSLTKNMTDSVLNTVASSLCNTLSYQKMTSVKIVEDIDDNIPYVKMKDPTASEITFIRTTCPSRQVLHVGCSDMECGFQSVYGNGGIQILNKMAGHGDWPWHAALFKEDVHVCDGTLVSSDWLITSSSCFQGQPKAEWTARLGTVRLASTSPWQQERRIVGLVKSPVEGSTIAMVKLEEPVHMSDFVRPICLPKEKSVVLSSNMSYCNTLGWARNREQLQRVQIKVNDMEKCDNVSIRTANSLCTEAVYSKDDCNEEELAGSPMHCLLPDGIRWSLVGVSNWRIACSKSGVERPRMYDKITSNVDWIHQTISAIS